jgi:hypothetical protein
MGQLLLLTHRIPSIRNTSKFLNTRLAQRDSCAGCPSSTTFLSGLNAAAFGQHERANPSRRV